MTTEQLAINLGNHGDIDFFNFQYHRQKYRPWELMLFGHLNDGARCTLWGKTQRDCYLQANRIEDMEAFLLQNEGKSDE